MNQKRASQANADIVIIGAGIIGAACAYRLAQDGYRVLILDNGTAAATAAGMGHLVCLDDNPAELALSHYSISLWRQLANQMPESCAWSDCGTLWLANNADEMEIARQKKQRLSEWQIESQLLNPSQVALAEPMLRSGLAGGLVVPSDSILYAPNVAKWLINAASHRVTLQQANVVGLEEQNVILSDGRRITAPAIILANGLRAIDLLPELPLVAKKGHLAITDRYPTRTTHQLVELGYAASAHASSGTSVAFNVQPRPTGQLLIGSSRQFDTLDSNVELPILRSMLQRAQSYLPDLATMNIIRCWTGFRAASPDGLPLLGQHPRYRGLWLAVGHEGLGVTTASGSADILAALLQGHASPIDATPYLASRFLDSEPNPLSSPTAIDGV
ncbi:NAD(P)/FAD-dependent oxidoreductase [Pragia fontium]|uniref:NAD(P)/FAD-dependent oxidoreductase n=1 Tax=Pragia fontium TaxID=82985 RepID=UPI000F6B5B53|nr:FAD-binding oxidoreductase [Pragia fontium]VEJ56763.1 Glycine oxidase [Pragia fontium]